MASFVYVFFVFNLKWISLSVFIKKIKRKNVKETWLSVKQATIYKKGFGHHFVRGWQCPAWFLSARWPTQSCIARLKLYQSEIRKERKKKKNQGTYLLDFGPWVVGLDRTFLVELIHHCWLCFRLKDSLIFSVAC